MTTTELICELRDQADVLSAGTLKNLIDMAADKIEELDERVDIMRADLRKES